MRRFCEPVNCQHCGSTFASDLPLRDHMRAKHPLLLKVANYRRHALPGAQRSKAIRKKNERKKSLTSGGTAFLRMLEERR